MKCICFVLLLSLSSLVAQEQPFSASEKRVRLKINSGSYKGTVESIDSDSLQLRVEETNVTKRFQRKSIEKIELSLGKKPIGVMTGITVGSLFGFAIGSAIEPGDDVPQLFVALESALAGALVGAGFGLFEKTEHWQEVSYQELLHPK